MDLRFLHALKPLSPIYSIIPSYSNDSIFVEPKIPAIILIVGASHITSFILADNLGILLIYLFICTITGSISGETLLQCISTLSLFGSLLI